MVASADLMAWSVQTRRMSDRQIRLTQVRGVMVTPNGGSRVILGCREKLRREILAARTLNRLRWSGREY